jgi:hypothetical protein
LSTNFASAAVPILFADYFVVCVQDLNMLLGSKRKVRKTLFKQTNINDFCNRLAEKTKEMPASSGARTE